MRLMGFDPGLRRTGWGVIESDGWRLSHLGNGVVASADDDPMEKRLADIHRGLRALIDQWRPEAAAVEESFVNANPGSTLKLGQVRGVVLLAPGLAGIPVFEYAPNQIKKAVVGAGHAAKEQIHLMVRHLLPGVTLAGPDAADALAVAICHAHRASVQDRWNKAPVAAGAR
jgi:crossover junction endodeoxyribonuclease RuvC